MTERKTAVVTGSTSGIGLGIAEALGAAGFDIVLNGFGSDAEIAGAQARVEAQGAAAMHHGADMSKPGEIAALVGSARARFGRIDVVVNNAGVQTVAPVEEFPVERWDLILAVNLSAAFHLTRLALGEMKERGWGRIVNVASAHALVASPFKSAYVAAKHGLLGFTRAVALEAAEQGVTSNAICPGYVLTPLVEKQIPEHARARGISEAAVIHDVLLAAQPTRQFATTGQIGALAAFLCSDAAAQITGAALPVDGGWTAQ